MKIIFSELSIKKRVIFLAIISVIVAVISGAILIVFKERGKNINNNTALNYEVANGYKFRISKFAENVGSISRIRITPDGNTMLVATLDGNVFAFRKINGNFEKQSKPFFSLKTNLPGFPPKESGLSGMALGADFEKSGDIFLLYTALTDKNILKNKITRVQFAQKNDGVYGENPVQIFEGNTDSETSHQIQGGAGVMVLGVPHLIFNVGDATKAEQSQDLTKEAGKVMLIQRDGAPPLGLRPFPDFPKIQAIGLRNAFDIAFNPDDPLKRFAIGDTGTDHFDRFLYAKVADFEGKFQKGLNLAWDGQDQSLQLPVKDENVKGNPETVLYRLDPTQTISDIVFYSGGGILLSIWGKTGSKDIQPGKKIMLGRLSDLDTQPKLELNDFIRRSQAGKGKLGHPLGLAVDPQTKTIYFGDILEGNIYKVEPY